MAVEVLELGEIEARGRAADGVEIEPADHVLRRHDLVVAMAPASRTNSCARPPGDTHRAIGIHAKRAMALGELGAVRPVDQRHMGKDRRLPAERFIDLSLPRGVGEVVVAADDMGDAHVMVVYNHGEIVGRRAVAAQDDKVVELLVGEDDAPMHAVVDRRVALARGPERMTGEMPTGASLSSRSRQVPS